MKKVEGYEISDDEWMAICPECDNEMEFEGFFDSADICKCPQCKTNFIVEKLVCKDGREIL